MSGLPEIDPDDWKANTEYSGGGDSGYTEDHPVIKVHYLLMTLHVLKRSHFLVISDQFRCLKTAA